MKFPLGKEATRIYPKPFTNIKPSFKSAKKEKIIKKDIDHQKNSQLGKNTCFPKSSLFTLTGKEPIPDLYFLKQNEFKNRV